MWVPRDLPLQRERPSIKAVGNTTRMTVDAAGQKSYASRYYILNRHLSGRLFAKAVLGH